MSELIRRLGELAGDHALNFPDMDAANEAVNEIERLTVAFRKAEAQLISNELEFARVYAFVSLWSSEAMKFEALLAVAKSFSEAMEACNNYPDNNIEPIVQRVETDDTEGGAL